MVLTLVRRDASRCALCHDSLDEASVACTGCASRAHESCRSELGARCPTLGCPGGERVPCSAPRQRLAPIEPPDFARMAVPERMRFSPIAWLMGVGTILIPALYWLGRAQLL